MKRSGIGTILSTCRAPLMGAWLSLFLLGCAGLSSDYPKPESTALEDYRSTFLGQQHAALEDAHPGKSGFALLRYGRPAFNVRIKMAQAAQKTIDVQVYIWEPDETGNIFAERLVRAADRGVRVRLLVDDLGFGGKDRALVAMDAHENIEVRIYNPFEHRSNHALDFLTDLDRVNHRMHNKTFIVDNSFAIVGGRNVGDHYFSVNPDTNFRDLDIAVVGPVVRDVSAVFDHFWRSESAVPASALTLDSSEQDFDLEAFASGVRQLIEQGSYPYSVDWDIVELDRELPAVQDLYIWARGGIVWDDPLADGTSDIIIKLRRKLDTLQSSLDIESAYFVVGDSGVERVRNLVQRGVTVRVMTNSLASNDVLAAHAGHAEFREELLEAGVEMYEMRPDSTVIKKTWVGESRAGLHTKALVFDRDSLLIGSFNLDPRSAFINTEAGIYVESEELAQQLLVYMAEGLQTENSYRVELDDDGELVWKTLHGGAEVSFDVDPHSTFWQRFMSGFIELLPVESQL